MMKLIAYLFLMLFFVGQCYGETDFKREVTIYFAYFTLPFTLLTAAPFVLSYQVVDDFSQEEKKLIAVAKMDAYTYVASNGAIASIYLEKALIQLRKKYSDTPDMELAKAIISY